MNFKARSALITGAGRGIGRAIAVRLAREGLDITVNDINANDATAVVHEIEALGRRGCAAVADVSKPAGAHGIVAQHHDTFGRLDVLVNNAGIMTVKTLFEHTEADWDRIFTINLKSQYFCMQAAVPIMVAQHFGKIINTCSMSAFFPSPQYASYEVSKAAVLSLTETVALELATHNIQVNCVCPGIIDTAMWDQITRQAQATTGAANPDDYMKTRVETGVAMKRAGTPDEVAAMYAFLASSDSDYITGQAMRVNGGMFRR
jgi:meso-butanediol dehydrogenase / (S,S)-butanediol dehydrogenase / diacetyl reductase